MPIKLLITDFDGTLVDTFEANYSAYKEAFHMCGLILTEEEYKQCFGLRFDNFMKAMGIESEKTTQEIRRLKAEVYPEYFDKLKVNRTLLNFIRNFRSSGGLTAIASTAREKNLRNALSHIGASDDFDIILSGESVRKGKPDPEIYKTVLHKTGVNALEALVFEDSEIGVEAAEAAGIRTIRIDNNYFK